MNLSGIAAILALAGIPASLLVARWQSRATLAQAQAALAQAEATYKSAVDAVKEKAKADHDMWLRTERKNACVGFLRAVDELRREESPTLLHSRIKTHNAFYEVEALCPDSIRSPAKVLDRRCSDYISEFCRLTPDEREEKWALVRLAREDFSEALQSYLHGNHGRS